MADLRIQVNLPGRGYDLLIGGNHLKSLKQQLAQLRLGNQPVVLSNPTILRRYGAKLTRALSGLGKIKRLTVADSERSKSLNTLNRLLVDLAALDGPGRRLYLVAVGGGVIGDLGGVAAGLYRRGIPYVQVPTTLLAQVDSSIGGKTGVDLPAGKNLVGLFNQPRLVFMETNFLRTLPDRQFRSGLAEVIKSGVIGDAALFSFLERTPIQRLREDAAQLAWVVARAAAVKVSLVVKDERETKGLRTLLNLGHTFGHALEAAHGYTRAYTHGEAVAIGMLVAARISRKMGLVSQELEERLFALIGRVGLPTQARRVSWKLVSKAMSHDKKWTRGRNRWVLPVKIGRCLVKENIPEGVIRSSVRTFTRG